MNFLGAPRGVRRGLLDGKDEFRTGRSPSRLVTRAQVRSRGCTRSASRASSALAACEVARGGGRRSALRRRRGAGAGAPWALLVAMQVVIPNAFRFVGHLGGLLWEVWR